MAGGVGVLLRRARRRLQRAAWCAGPIRRAPPDGLGPGARPQGGRRKADDDGAARRGWARGKGDGRRPRAYGGSRPGAGAGRRPGTCSWRVTAATVRGGARSGLMVA